MTLTHKSKKTPSIRYRTDYARMGTKDPRPDLPFSATMPEIRMTAVEKIIFMVIGAAVAASLILTRIYA